MVDECSRRSQGAVVADRKQRAAEVVAEREPDPERQCTLRSLGRRLVGAVRDVVVDVAGAAACSMGKG